jgi:hypothetical protein
MRSINRLGALLAIWFALLVILPDGPARADDRALLIGINKYQNFKPLSAAVNDVRLMKTVVRKVWGFGPGQIKVLTDQRATAGNIRDALLNWLTLGTGPGDRVLLYYSGHGVCVPDDTGDEPDGRDEALAAYDAHPAGHLRFRNVITDDELRRSLADLKDREVMVIADSCYSGTVTRALTPAWRSAAEQLDYTRGQTRSAVGTRDFCTGRAELSRAAAYEAMRGEPSLMEGRDNLMVWTAVSATQLALERADTGNGLFTHAFAQGLMQRRADRDGNGRITAAELLNYLRARSQSYCQQYGMAGETYPTPVTPTFEPPARAAKTDLLSWGRRSAPEALASLSDLVPAEDRLRLKVELIGGERLGGEPLRVRVTSPREGYLIVLDRRDSGEVVQLFPSICTHASRRIRANAPITIPDDYFGCEFAPDERGRGEIIVIVTEDNVALDRLLNRHKDLEVVASGDQYLAEIVGELMAVWTGDERNRAVRWGMASEDYVIR